MKKLLLLLIMCFVLSGCSLLPRVNFDTPNTVPQTVDKGKVKSVCKGSALFNDNGDIISCSKGYYSYEENYAKQERKMTIVERIKSFINNLAGWGFWGTIILVILCPSLVGLIAGRILEGIYGMGNKAFKQVSAAIQKVKNDDPSLVDALEKSTDSDVRKWIEEFKKKNGIK